MGNSPLRLRDMDDLGAYLLQDWLNNRAHCQCGWAGKRRWLRAGAVLDVLMHCAETSHMPVGFLTLQRVDYAF